MLGTYSQGINIIIFGITNIHFMKCVSLNRIDNFYIIFFGKKVIHKIIGIMSIRLYSKDIVFFRIRINF